MMADSSDRKLRILLADDHPVLRSGLRVLFDAQPDMVVTAEVADGAALVASVAGTGVDVAIVDLAMPGMGGIAATAELRRAAPDVKVLAFSANDTADGVGRMLDAGACGYVVKGASGDELVRAVRCVAAGGTYLDPVVAAQVVTPRPSDRVGPALSERESSVLRRLAQGHALKDVAAEMEISVRTVETYKQRAMEKLALKTRADVVRYAVAQGWLGPSA